MSTSNIALIQSLYAAFGRGDVSTILAGCAPDVDWQTVGRPSDFPSFGPRKGVAAVGAFFEGVGGSLDFQDFSPRDFHVSGDIVFVFGHYAMTVKKNGKKIASDFIHCFTMRDGKVVKFREFTDTAQLAEAYR